MKKILWLGEATFLSTGYGTYGHELLKRLHSTGKYEIAELAAYGHELDPRVRQIPWKFYGNLPHPQNQEEIREYEASPFNQFGKWKFEQVCIDYQPDVVLDVRDAWYFQYIFHSPVRKFFKFIISPTVDAEPQLEDWIADYALADGVITYNDWSLALLKQQGKNKVKLIGAIPPGVDLSTFQSIRNKREHRLSIGMEPDIFVILTVMRNQKRKLYPDLFEAFRKFLQTAPEAIAKKTFLYCHTTYPDAGFNLCKLLKNHELSHKVLFTYICRNCGSTYPSFFNDIRSFCRNCNQPTAFFPNSQIGCDRNVLAKIMNLADIYCQYANSEACGIPIIEAAACQLPIMAVDYSGQNDVVKKVNGYPIKVKAFQTESETGCLRAIPDNDDLAAKLVEFFQLPEMLRSAQGFQSRQGVEKYYDWDKNTKLWENAIDSIPDNQLNWSAQPMIHQPATQFPENINNEEFLRLAFVYTAGRPDLINSYMYQCMLRDLNTGCSNTNYGGFQFSDMSVLGGMSKYREYTRENVIQDLLKVCENNNKWESYRWNYVQKFSRKV